jgi:CrcB protein|tara:strand:+ start:655 stop:1041 length:387 start_codon:yes stop_codon:yes gene_type:complete
MFTPTNFLLVGIASAFGAWARWVIGYLCHYIFPGLPYGSLAVNLLGGFLMGCSIAYFQSLSYMSEELKIIINIGFLGGLTTFSAFTADLFHLFNKDQQVIAIFLMLGHVFGSLILAFLGWHLFNLILK